MSVNQPLRDIASISVADFVDYQGQIIPILMKPDDTLDMMKSKIQQKTGIDASHQKLIAGNVSQNAPKMGKILRQEWFAQEKKHTEDSPMRKSTRYFILKTIHGL